MNNIQFQYRNKVVHKKIVLRNKKKLIELSDGRLLMVRMASDTKRIIAKECNSLKK